VVVDRENPERILSAGVCWTAAGSIGRIAAGNCLDRFAANDRILCGPEMAVAFYRRDVLESVNALRHHGSELAAAMDLALALRKAGYRAVQEPSCVTTATGKSLASAGAWTEGVASEKLFHRWTAVPGWKRSWAAHSALVAMECLQSPLRPSILGRLAGRLWATLGFGSPRPVVIYPQVASSPECAVIRPPHFSAADARPAMQSRAVG